MLYRLRASQALPIAKKEAWAFLTNPRNLQKITPSKMNFTIIYGADEPIHEGQILKYSVTPLPFYSTTWVSEIAHVKEEEYFVDNQLQGPYALWHHKHRLREIAEGTLVEDIVYYSLPLGVLGKMAHVPIVQKQLLKIFKHRESELSRLFGTVEKVENQIIFD